MTASVNLTLSALLALTALSAARQPTNSPGSGPAGADWGLWIDGDESPANSTVVLATRPPPGTMLESALRTQNALVTTSFSELSTFAGENGASLRLLVAEVRAGDLPRYGVVVEVRSKAGRATSYIDDGELPKLVESLRDLARTDRSGTRFQFVSSQYQTPGGLMVTNRGLNGSRVVTVRATQVLDSGQLILAACPMQAGRFSQFIQSLEAAARQIESVR